MLSALSYIHACHICHCDVKLENTFIMSEDVSDVVLADFGLAIELPDGVFGEQFCGSLRYAPEIGKKCPLLKK
jgi:serine/threonine protein kinase